MRKTVIILFLMMMILSDLNAQCYSRKGIMNESCRFLTIVTPPAYDVSLGLSNTHILKVEINYITENEIVYGASFGVRSNKSRLSGMFQEDANFNAFVGYNLVGCIIIGVTESISHYSKSFTQDDQLIKKTGFKNNMGFSIKLISNFTTFPVTIGGYGNMTEIGMTIGTIF